MQETRVPSLGWDDLLEKEMATHSSIPAWEIPLSEETMGYNPRGHERVGHDWAIKQQQQTYPAQPRRLRFPPSNWALWLKWVCLAPSDARKSHFFFFFFRMRMLIYPQPSPSLETLCPLAWMSVSKDDVSLGQRGLIPCGHSTAIVRQGSFL